jgi:hypothetical protein
LTDAKQQSHKNQKGPPDAEKDESVDPDHLEDSKRFLPKLDRLNRPQG